MKKVGRGRLVGCRNAGGRSAGGALVGVAIAALVLITGGCATRPDEAPAVGASGEVVGDAPLTNEIRVNGHRFAVPAAWEFGPGFGDGVVLTFRDEDRLTGQLEVLPLDNELSLELLLEYFEERLFPSDRRVTRSVITSSQFGDVTVIEGSVEGRRTISLVDPGMERVVLLHIGTEPQVFVSSAEALRLLETYRFEPELPDFRLGDDRIGFVAVDPNWRWTTDIGDGFYALYIGEGPPLAVAIRRGDDEAIGELASEFNEIDVPAVVPVIRGAEGPVRAFEDEDFRWNSFYLVYPRHDALYVLKVTYPRSNQRSAETVFSDPAIQNLLDFSLVYPGMVISSGVEVAQ
ncbi:MAG: hypothetical protein ACLFR8_14060 [Alkalispirochaeta sp.]